MIIFYNAVCFWDLTFLRFFQPVALNCGHVYCNFCIDQWKAKCQSGHFNCPNCRAKITSVNRSLYLENILEAFFNDVEEDAKKEREALVAERKG